MEENTTTQSTEEKLFTQEEVNKIVSERLARAKNQTDKATQEADAEREKQLSARESRLTCREYLIEKGYSAEFLELIDTSDVDEFKNKIEKIQSIARPRVHTPQPFCPERGDRSGGVIAEPFKSKKAHTPYKGY